MERAGSLLFKPAAYVEQLELEEIFPEQQPLEVELGAGDGSFLVQWAKRNPAHNFLGVERLLGRIRKIERKASRAGLQNVRLMRIEARYFLEYLLPERSVTRLHVYFPDPWPKRKHWKNRLVNAHFVEVAARVLKRGGEVFFRTDDKDYFEQITSVFGADRKFGRVETSEELRETLTDFERTFQEQGVRTLSAAYELKGKAAP